MTRRNARLVVVGLLVAATSCSTGEKIAREEIPHLYDVHDTAFQRSMSAVGGAGTVDGNHVDALQNGDEIFPAMLRAIRDAQRSVDFTTYIYWSGDVGREFAQAFADRARAGVKVRVLVDWVGASHMDRSDVELMQQAGVEFRKFHALHWYSVQRMNRRMHRKVLVVDGRIGFTGGVGIAPQWTGDAQDRDHWRDSHFRFEGPVVAQMQASFADDWVKTTGEWLQGDDYFPPLERAGGQAAQVFSSSPSGGSDGMELTYLLAIAAASKSIRLSCAYFVPGPRTRVALVEALHRGVSVEIVTPGKYMDVETVRHASRAHWGQLLEAGARIYEYAPTMYHCKVLIVDDYFVAVGSTNLDPRSFDLNDEVNLDVFDDTFGRAMSEVFARDVAASQEIDLAAWRHRPFPERVLDELASLLGFLL